MGDIDSASLLLRAVGIIVLGVVGARPDAVPCSRLHMLGSGRKEPQPHSSCCHSIERWPDALPWTGSSCCMPEKRLSVQVPGSIVHAVLQRTAAACLKRQCDQHDTLTEHS